MTNQSPQSLAVELNLIPKQPGVYLMKNANNEIIYVGKAKNLRQRLRSYFGANPSGTTKVMAMISHITDFETIVCANEVEALILESTLIKKHQPHYNILLKDDRDYPYLRVTWQEQFPRILKAYRVGEDVKQGAKYYGPYQNGDLARALLAVREIFPQKTCKLVFPRDIGKVRPCLNYHIGRCLGPCSGEVSAESYRESIAAFCDFFEGKRNAVQENLEREMKQAAASLQFEKATLLRNRLDALTKLLHQQIIVTEQKKAQDYIGYMSQGGQACLNRLQLREGRVISSVPFFVPDIAGEPDEIIKSFLMQHYADATDLPAQIMVGELFNDTELIGQALSQARDRKVEVKTPRRGEAVKLLEMAEQNAKVALEHDMLQNGRNLVAKQKALTALARYLGRPEQIARIEAYDIANYGAETQTAAMVVFFEGASQRSSYRHFQIKEQAFVDDYEAMRQVISRRLERLNDSKFGAVPDLILVDGGTSHVNAVLPIIQKQELNIAVAGIVKDERHRTRGLALANGEIIELAELIKAKYQTIGNEQNETFALWRLLTAIQNEAHRFANRILRQTKKKKTLRYSLESIKGVGPAKRKLLLAHFGSIKKISEASLEELQALTKLGNSAAEAVHRHFREAK